MWTPGHAVKSLKRHFAHWEPNGAWDGNGWYFREKSDGLTDWLSHQERKNPDVWRVAVREHQQLTIRGERFDYRLFPRGEGLIMERKPK